MSWKSLNNHMILSHPISAEFNISSVACLRCSSLKGLEAVQGIAKNVVAVMIRNKQRRKIWLFLIPRDEGALT